MVGSAWWPCPFLLHKSRHLPQPRRDDWSFGDRSLHRLERLQAVTCDTEHHFVPGFEPARARQRERARGGDAPRRLGEHAGVLGEKADPLDQLRVAPRRGPPAGLSHCPGGEHAVRGTADREGAADGLGHFRLEHIAAALHQADDRSAPGGLCAVQPRQPAPYQPRVEKLAEPLAQLREERAARHRRDDRRRQAPAELLGDLVRDGLRPLDRKSTRLNSSHVAISYAVFCLKKKKTRHLSEYTALILAIIDVSDPSPTEIAPGRCTPDMWSARTRSSTCSTCHRSAQNHALFI